MRMTPSSRGDLCGSRFKGRTPLTARVAILDLLAKTRRDARERNHRVSRRTSKDVLRGALCRGPVGSRRPPGRRCCFSTRSTEGAARSRPQSARATSGGSRMQSSQRAGSGCSLARCGSSGSALHQPLLVPSTSSSAEIVGACRSRTHGSVGGGSTPRRAAKPGAGAVPGDPRPLSVEIIDEGSIARGCITNLSTGACPDRAGRDKADLDPESMTRPCHAAGLRLWRDKQTLFAPPGLYLIESQGDARIFRRQEYEITPDLGCPDTKTLAKAAHHVLYLLPIGSPSDRPSRWNIHAAQHNPASV